MNQNTTKQSIQNKIIAVFFIIVLISLWVTVIIVYPRLPESIPLKFNYDGTPAQTGPKYIFFLLPAVATFLWGKSLAINQTGLFGIKFLENVPVLKILAQLVIFTVCFVLIKLTVGA